MAGVLRYLKEYIYIYLQVKLFLVCLKKNFMAFFLYDYEILSYNPSNKTFTVLKIVNISLATTIRKVSKICSFFFITAWFPPIMVSNKS